ncbi:MAG: enoyl-CoA hydratase/isomerase family protein [Armatimonadetes bacterium]|nr:enoyl-CoA hydratase/isomerase family protein [Armatimonadota bacterium]MDW8154430.1 enoyl-CoA hydratase/isomerase family protein [Armatimonadota bacterium]
MTEEILFEREDSLAILTLNRPEALNALTVQMLERMQEHLETVEADPAVRVVLVTAAGERAFCVGADLKGRAQEYEAGVTEDPMGKRIRRLLRHLETLDRPVIAAIHGYCLGGGWNWRWPAASGWLPRRCSSGFPRPTWGACRERAVPKGSRAW